MESSSYCCLSLSTIFSQFLLFTRFNLWHFSDKQIIWWAYLQQSFEYPILFLGINFTNNLRSAFTRADPKSGTRQSRDHCLFALLESDRIKADRKTLVKLTLGEWVSSLLSINNFYRIYQGFRLNLGKSNDIIFGHFWPLSKWAAYFEAAQPLTVIGPNLKPNHHDQVKLLQIADTNNSINDNEIDNIC